MIPVDIVDSILIENILLIVGAAMLASIMLYVILTRRNTATTMDNIVISFSLIGGGLMLAGIMPIEGADRHHKIISWAEERYNIHIPEEKKYDLTHKEIITLTDGTKVQLTLPEKDAEGYQLYNTVENTELPVEISPNS
jgi:hypothetical protein